MSILQNDWGYCGHVGIAEKDRTEGIPLTLDIPALDIERMTETELDAALEKGYSDVLAGRTVPVAQAFVEIRRECGL